MDVAERTSYLSYAKRLRVGAVIVKDNRILSYGYNGMPSGWDNNCEFIDKITDWGNPDQVEQLIVGAGYELHEEEDGGVCLRRLKTRPEVLHAESNAIAKVASSNENSQDSTMFCTHAPCIDCAKLIYQSGIKTLYYKNTYRTTSGLEFLEKSGVNVIRYQQQS